MHKQHRHIHPEIPQGPQRRAEHTEVKHRPQKRAQKQINAQFAARRLQPISRIPA